MGMTLWFVNIFVVVVLAVVLRMSVAFNTRDIFFAVTVGPQFAGTPEGRSIIEQYRRGVLVQGVFWCVAVVAAAAYAFTLPLEKNMMVAQIACVVSLIGLVVGGTHAFIKARARALPHAVQPTAIRQSIPSEPVQAPTPHLWTPGIVVFALIPFVAIAGAAVYLKMRWNDIPIAFPMHWNAAGKVDSWGTRSVGNVFVPLGVGAGILAFIICMGWIMIRQMRSKFTVPQAIELELKAKRAIMIIILATGWLVASIFTAFSVVVPFNTSEALPAIPMLIIEIGLPVFLVLTFVIVIRSVRLLREAAKVSAAALPEGEIVGDGTEDRFWKWGMFYHNPDDPALWVSRRFGVGWTMNMARPAAWAWLVAMMIIPLLIAIIGALLAK